MPDSDAEVSLEEQDLEAELPGDTPGDPNDPNKKPGEDAIADGSAFTVPCCVCLPHLLCNLGRWKDYIEPFILTHSTVIMLAAAVNCHYGFTDAHCSMVSIAACGICFFANYVIWKSGSMNMVFMAMREENTRLEQYRKQLQSSRSMMTADTKLISVANNVINRRIEKMEGGIEIFRGEMREFATDVRKMKRARIDIRESTKMFSRITDRLKERDDEDAVILEDLEGSLKDLSRYLGDLNSYIRVLDQKNAKMAKTKEQLKDKLRVFNLLKTQIEDSGKWANNIFEMAKHLEQRYIQLVELSSNYERNYIMQIVHSAEFIDGNPGFDEDKILELIDRFPKSIKEQSKKNLQKDFQFLERDEYGMVDFREILELVKKDIIPQTDAWIEANPDEATPEEPTSEDWEKSESRSHSLIKLGDEEADEEAGEEADEKADDEKQDSPAPKEEGVESPKTEETEKTKKEKKKKKKKKKKGKGEEKGEGKSSKSPSPRGEEADGEKGPIGAKSPTGAVSPTGSDKSDKSDKSEKSDKSDKSDKSASRKSSAAGTESEYATTPKAFFKGKARKSGLFNISRERWI